MSYEWMQSAKGNLYTKIDDRLCVIGKSKYGWCALVDDQFLEGDYGSEEEAKEAGIEALNGKTGVGMEWTNDANN